MPKTKKPKKKNIKSYNMYDFIAMSQEDAGKVLLDECAKKKPNIELIQNILEFSPVNVNLQDEDGQTALKVASRNCHTKIVKLLLQKPEIDKSLSGKWEFSEGDVFNGNTITEGSCPNCGSDIYHDSVDEARKSWKCGSCETTGEDCYDTDEDEEPYECPKCKSIEIYPEKNEYCGDYYELIFQCSDCGHEVDCSYGLIFTSQEFEIP